MAEISKKAVAFGLAMTAGLAVGADRAVESWQDSRETASSIAMYHRQITDAAKADGLKVTNPVVDTEQMLHYGNLDRSVRETDHGTVALDLGACVIHNVQINFYRGYFRDELVSTISDFAFYAVYDNGSGFLDFKDSADLSAQLDHQDPAATLCPKVVANEKNGDFVDFRTPQG